MSTTFTFPTNKASCSCPDFYRDPCPSGCGETIARCQCGDTSDVICGFCVDRMVNLANGNAREVLEALGLPAGGRRAHGRVRDLDRGQAPAPPEIVAGHPGPTMQVRAPG